MRIDTIVGIGIVAVTLTAVPAEAQYRCAHGRDVEASLDADDLAGVLVFARSGSLDVRGGDTDRVRVRGEVCASHEDLLDDAELTLDRYRDRARIEVRLPDTGWREYVRMDLVVELPARLGVEIDDSSGDLVVSDVASAVVDDGSGDMRIERIDGDLEVHDGSGMIEIYDVGGDIRLDDNSGDIEIDGVRGGVLITDDGSGEIDIRNVDRDVIIEDDGSGSIHVAYVGGDFVVEDDGSGSIRYHEVAGEVRIPSRKH